jgi:hypothetical protein
MEQELVTESRPERERECFANSRLHYMVKRPMEVCQPDYNALLQSLSTPHNVQTSRLLAATVDNFRLKPEGRRWSLQLHLLSVLKHSPIPFCSRYLPYLSDKPHNLI